MLALADNTRFSRLEEPAAAKAAPAAKIEVFEDEPTVGGYALLTAADMPSAPAPEPEEPPAEPKKRGKRALQPIDTNAASPPAKKGKEAAEKNPVSCVAKRLRPKKAVKYN